MSGVADLAVVSSPLQYMNAVEWRRRAAGRAADLVLIGDRAGGEAAIELQIAREPGLWRSVRRHPRRPLRHRWTPAFAADVADARHRASLASLAARLDAQGVGALAFGDYRNVSQRALVERIAHDRLVLLDDGSITPQAARFRAGLAAPDPGRFAARWFRTAAARTLFGDPPPPPPPALTFFTIYAGLIGPGLATGDRVAPHAFEGWRNGARRARGDAVWLIGANHAEARIASAGAYRRLILGGAGALRQAGFDGPITYCPHRGECRAAADSLAREGGFRLQTSPAPVEIAYLEAAAPPAAVAVVASSAADTLAAIDPELPIARFALPDGYLQRQRDHILAVVQAHDAFNPRLRVLEPRAVSAGGARIAP